jgi:hypothetical protein
MIFIFLGLLLLLLVLVVLLVLSLFEDIVVLLFSFGCNVWFAICLDSESTPDDPGAPDPAALLLDKNADASKSCNNGTGILLSTNLINRIDPSITCPVSRTIPNRSANRCTKHR